MTDLLKAGSDLLASTLRNYAASAVTYRHLGIDYTVYATFAETRYEQVDTDGTTVGTQGPDFLILADELGFEPSRYDTIKANGRTYTITRNAAENLWVWTDRYNTMYRIHTKDTGTA